MDETKLDPWYAARDSLCRALEDNLLGDPHEGVLHEPPLNRIAAGILHPQGVEPVEQTSVDESGTESVPASESDVDSPVSLSRVRAPSSMGMTFAVDSGVTAEVALTFSADRYVEVTGSESHDDGSAVDVITRGGRGTHADSSWELVAVTSAEPWVIAMGSATSRYDVAPGLEARVIVRAESHSTLVRITVVLLNTQTHTPGEGQKDQKCWFRPTITASVATGCFVDRKPRQQMGVDDPDHATNALLFRTVENLAVGHGCAIDWSAQAPVTTLTTTFLPTHELALAEASGGDYVLDMVELGSGAGREALLRMHSDYCDWIEGRSLEVPGLDEEFRETGQEHVDRARRAAGRILAGIELIAVDPQYAGRAFALMNEAMNEQRVRQERIRSGDPELEVAAQRWRPFQMAFILMNLPGLSDGDHPEREIVDLLWFPTGGGKTEAYLGAMAYSIILRRLRDPRHGGVSVIMRYTLRLLTIQQFERAATLVCALELIREREISASPPIGLGLWVGLAATPNTVEEAAKVLKNLGQGDLVEQSNPRQLLRCPWCGAELGIEQYVVSKAKDKLTIQCSDLDCAFYSGLPVHLTDQDVYRERPSIVIGTVDKFAAMAWREQVSALVSTDGSNPSPDLIVQDELHLISGPLGTMVGLYESVVDLACSRSGRPKVIASTATIRRAQKQVRAVFDRRAEQFPPPGLDAQDTYFSTESRREEKGTRLYLGVLAPGVSQSTLTVRIYAALLDAAGRLRDEDPAKDAYWTLLGYFNSLRVLGGAYLQVVDDVPDRLKLLAKRNGSVGRELRGEPDELTSRKRSSEIPKAMRALETSYPDANSPDVVLATNMISVGLDVDRLGLMAVAGQPQSTAEYIQSTSRVGRRHPGLVVVAYNAARSRDKSHYESFTSYHRALYREVEATTATPFAPRARDRGAHGVLVSASRLLIGGLRSDAAAGAIDKHVDEVRDVIASLVARAMSVAPAEADHYEAQLSQLVDHWLEGAGTATKPVKKYPGWRTAVEMLLVPAGGGEGDGETMTFPVTRTPWPTLTSMRDVDATTKLELRRRPRRGR